jgi:hypothetical protein
MRLRRCGTPPTLPRFLRSTSTRSAPQTVPVGQHPCHHLALFVVDMWFPCSLLCNYALSALLYHLCKYALPALLDHLCNYMDCQHSSTTSAFPPFSFESQLAPLPLGEWKLLLLSRHHGLFWDADVVASGCDGKAASMTHTCDCDMSTFHSPPHGCDVLRTPFCTRL